MFRAIAFIPIQYVEAAYYALVTSDLFTQPYSLNPKDYKPITGARGKFETEEVFREKLTKFSLYIRVSAVMID